MRPIPASRSGAVQVGIRRETRQVNGTPRTTRFASGGHHGSKFLGLGDCPECDMHLGKWFHRFCWIAFQECRDWHIAEDLAQQAVTAISKHGHNMLHDNYSYHLQQLRWVITDYRRKRHAALVGDHNTEAYDCAIEAAPPPWLDIVISPRTQRALQALPERQRQVIKATYFDNLSDDEIARKLTIAVATVRNYRSLALKRLEALLENESR